MILEYFQRLAARRPPDFVIGTKEDPYLRRWWVIPRNRFFNLYLHQMLRDDDDVLHDHPWWSLSRMLDGVLVENYQRNPPHGEKCSRILLPRMWVWRSSRFAHQLVVHQPAWTLFFTGPVLREWGFWCPKGFKVWKDYVAIRDNVSGVGKGCGEH